METELMPATEARERYERDGFFLHTDPVLSPEELEQAARGLELVRDGLSDTGEEPAGRMGDPGSDPRALCKIEQPQLASLALREALRSPRLGRLAGEVTGANWVQVWWVQGLCKPAAPEEAAGALVGWHQDQAYWGGWEQGSGLFTAWLALSDVTADAGPMVFVPGSHRWGLLPGGNFFSSDQESLRAAIQIPAGEVWREVADILPAGGVSFHHQLLFHGSHQNRSNGPRRSIAIHMRTETARSRPDNGFARYLDRPEICPVIFQR